MCPCCHKTGKGKVCTSCGTTLVVAREMSCSSAGPGSSGHSTDGAGCFKPDPHSIHQSSTSNDAPAGGTIRLDDGPTKTSSAPPELRLMNKNLNIDLAIQDESVLGRATGNYVSIFGSYNQVSSRHCSFSFETGRGWCVTDNGSTNGTKLNNTLLQPNISQPLKNQMFLKIANIEFYVQIK